MYLYGVEQVVAPGKQRAVLAGGIRATGRASFGFRPRVQPSVDEPSLPEVVLEMVFGHAPGNDRHPAPHGRIQLLAFTLYQFREIFYVHNQQ